MTGWQCYTRVSSSSVGTPKVLYEHPDNLFVAAFIGSPAMNLFEAILSPDGTELKLGSQSLTLPEKVSQARPRLAAYRDRKIIVGIRPENLADAAISPPSPGNTLNTEVELVEALGNELQVHFLIDATRAHSEDTAAATGEAELGELSVAPPRRSAHRRGREDLAAFTDHGRVARYLRRRYGLPPLLRPGQHSRRLVLTPLTGTCAAAWCVIVPERTCPPTERARRSGARPLRCSQRTRRAHGHFSGAQTPQCG